MTPTALMKVLARKFPTDATSWSQATDEIRDMSCTAREMVGFSELHAVPFEVIKDPAVWNTRGIHSIGRFYQVMTADQRAAFINNWHTVLG